MVQHTLQIQITNLNNIEPVINATISAAVPETVNVKEIKFTLSDQAYANLKKQTLAVALADAPLADAQAQAELIAPSHNLTLTPPTSVDETVSYQTYTAKLPGDTGEGLQMPPPTLQVQATVKVTYTIAQY